MAPWKVTRLPLLVALLGLVAPDAAAAHDIESTFVRIAVSSDGRFRVDILNHADWLWQRLVGTEYAPPDARTRDLQLAGRTQAFMRHVILRFDGAAAAIDGVSYIPPGAPTGTAISGTAAPGRMRLDGMLPPGASTVEFAYRLVVDPYPLTIVPPRGDPITHWVAGGAASPAVAIAGPHATTRLGVTRQYLALGVLHILPRGVDHILFVLGLFLLSPRLKPLLLQVTAFTIAHTVTLGLAINGTIALPAHIVEPLIALSIAYVGVENVVTPVISPWRIGLVFAFGLLHGMGFAGVLADLGLPAAEGLTALVSFNLGVEIGQVAVIGAASAAAAGIRRRPWYRRRVAVPASLAIAATGLYWTVERLGL